MNFSTSLEHVRKHTAIVQRMEFALKNDPQNSKLQMGLGSAKRRASESQLQLDRFAAMQQIDLIRYKISNLRNSYAAKSVADSISTFQSSFTGIVDFLDSGPKEKSRFSAEIVRESELDFAYTFPGSLGVVLAVQNNRDLLEGKFDKAVDVYSEYLEIDDMSSAVDASRHLGSALITQLFSWVETNAKWQNEVDFVWKRSNGILRGQNISRQKFSDLSEIFKEAKDDATDTIVIEGMLVGLDLESATFHFVVPGGIDYKGKLGDAFEKTPTIVGNSYIANLVVKTTRKVATGKTTIVYELQNLN